jgi:uncharacterized protein (TIGR02246 family)
MPLQDSLQEVFMKAKSKKRPLRKSARTSRKPARAAGAAATIRQIGNDWAQNWNAGDLEKVVAVYAPDAVYLPPHHEAVHGRDAIRGYLQGPRSHGVSGLAFDVTYIKQSGDVAWDVGTYRMSVPQSDGTRREDHGKYLTVWTRAGTKWLITADAWSSDLPPGQPLL